MKKRDDIHLGNLSSVTDVADDRVGKSKAKPVKKEEKTGSGLFARMLKPSEGLSIAHYQVVGMVFSLVFFIGLSGFFSWQISQIREQLSSTSKESNLQLGELQSKLDSTDVELSEKGDETTKTLKNHNSEIRKLWDIANKKNKPAIDKNAAALKVNRQTMDKLRKQILASDNKISQQIALMDRYETQIAMLVDSNQILEGQVAKQKTALAQLSEKLKGEGLAAQVANNSNRISQSSKEYEQRLSAIEQTRQSMDSFRRQTNAELESIKVSVRTLLQTGE